MVSGITACAQNKVAEGEYEIHRASSTGAPLTKTATRWVLTSISSGGYHLESEIQNQPAGVRVVQREELDELFVPLAIGYALYRKSEKEPSISVMCDVAKAVTCSGTSGSDRAANSVPYQPDRPFWLWMDNVYSLDMQWLLGGAVNMAHLETGKTRVATVAVFGGTAVMLGDAVNVAALEAVKAPGQTLGVVAPTKPIGWEVRVKEESQLELIGTETLDMFGSKISTKHYAFGNGSKPMNLWTAGPGLVVKFNNSILTHYTQYKKLIPELPTEVKQISSIPSHSEINPQPTAQVPQSVPIPPSAASTPVGAKYELEPIHVPRLVYPSTARQQKIQGVVVAMMLVSETGVAEAVRILEGDEVLADAVQLAAREWKFKPVTRDGKAVPVISKVKFDFVLGSDDRDPKDIVPEIAPATDFPEHVRVSKGIMQGLMLRNSSPVYPPEAKEAHIQGIVMLQAVISKEGKVTHLQLVSGPPELAAAAMGAVQNWLYRPYRLYGRPVEVDTQVQINFALRET
jgi:TonB family protein